MPHNKNMLKPVLEMGFLEPISNAESTFMKTSPMEGSNASQVSVMVSDMNSNGAPKSFALRKHSPKPREFHARSCARRKQAQIKKVQLFLLDETIITFFRLFLC